MFFKNARSDIAVLVADAPDSVAVVTRAGFATWQLLNQSRPMFTRDWKAWTPVVQPIGAPEPIVVSDVDSLRKIIRGPVPGCVPQFDPGVLDALALRFPEGDTCYFDQYEGFIHRFADVEDARLLAMRRGGTPIIFQNAEELGSLPFEYLVAVAAALDAKGPSANPKQFYLQELYQMAKAAKAKQKKKVATVQAKAKRADGPVARARALFEKAVDPKDTQTVLEACHKAGIASATAKTQLYQWRKEKGIKAERGRPKEKAKATTTKKSKGKKEKPAGAGVKEQAAVAEVKAKSKTKRKRVLVPAGTDPKAAHAAAGEQEQQDNPGDVNRDAPGAVEAAAESRGDQGD